MNLVEPGDPIPDATRSVYVRGPATGLRRGDPGAVPVRGDAAEPGRRKYFAGPKRLQRAGAIAGGLFLAALLVGMLLVIITGGPQLGFAASVTNAIRPSTSGVYGSVESFGAALFTNFLLPFELTSLVFLVALIGAVVLGKRR